MADKVECRSCCFFYADKGENDGNPGGECRRKAPALNWRVAEWPRINPDDFCGEFLKAAQ